MVEPKTDVGSMGRSPRTESAFLAGANRGTGGG
jgi:hypothetical protein